MRSEPSRLPRGSQVAEKFQKCQSEGAVCPRNLLFSWDWRKSRSLASLGMTLNYFFRSLVEAARFWGGQLFASLLPCACGRVRISCCINPDYEHSANIISAATQFARQAR